MANGKKKTSSFDNDGIGNLPKNKPVVYKILNKNNENIYTGVAKRGRVGDRLKEHLPGQPDRIQGGVKVQIQQKSSIDEALKSEARIIAKNKPKFNKKGK